MEQNGTNISPLFHFIRLFLLCFLTILILLYFLGLIESSIIQPLNSESETHTKTLSEPVAKTAKQLHTNLWKRKQNNSTKCEHQPD